MLSDTSKTDDSLQNSFDNSVKKLDKTINNIKKLRSSLIKEYELIIERCDKLLSQRKSEDLIQLILSWVASFSRRILPKKPKNQYPALIILEEHKQDISNRLRRLKKQSNRQFKATKMLVQYNLENTPRLEAFLEKSNKYIGWSIFPIVIPYMSIYLSKTLLLYQDKVELFQQVVIIEIAVACVFH